MLSHSYLSIEFNKARKQPFSVRMINILELNEKKKFLSFYFHLENIIYNDVLGRTKQYFLID